MRSRRLRQTTDLRAEPRELPLRSNLQAFLSQLISKRTPHDNLIFIFGDPGIGKTSLAQIYAAALAQQPDVHPVFIPLKYIDPKADHLVSEIEGYLENESPLRDAVSNLQFCSNVVFIPDGFDELAQATRTSMEDFFRRLERFCTDGLYRRSAVIATGRHTLFSEYDAAIPSNTHVITLKPFDKNQIGEWSSKWNGLTGQSFDGTRFWQDEEDERGDLHEIATLPMLLYLLAKLEESGQPVDPQEAEMSRSKVYRDIIQWCCARHEQRLVGEDTTLTKAQMLAFLRIAGFCTMALGSRALHLEQLQEMIERSGLTIEQVQKKENYEAEQTILSMTFRRIGEASWEFKHKSFGEYLAAEYIGERLGRAIAKEEDSFSAEEWRMNTIEVAGLWAELFARNIITPEVQALLQPMLGDWKAFIQGKGADNREEGLKSLLERCGAMYARFMAEADMQSLVTIASDAGIKPTQALVNCVIMTMMLGSYCARSLSSENEKVYFNLEKYSPGSWWKMHALLKQHADFYSLDLLQRFFAGVSLDNPEGIQPPGSFCHGLTLPYIKISKIQKESQSASDDNIYMRGAYFYNSDLSGIDLSFVNLDGAILDYARLYRARLDRAILEGARLDRAILEGASLNGARLNGASLDRARLEGASLDRASLEGARLDRANLEGASLDRASLEGASLVEARLYRTRLDRAILQGARLYRARLVETILEGARLGRANLRGCNLKEISGWRQIESIKLANVYGVVDAPDGFLEWSREMGAVEIESDEEWERVKSSKSR